jgi:hypothetical protein
MTPTKLTKQMLDFQKTTFDNAFNTVILIQDQTEKMTSSFLNQAPGFPKEGQNTINEWANAFKKGRDDFKKAVDESFEKMETFFSESGKIKKS